MSVPGLFLYKNVLSVEQEYSLLEKINDHQWKDNRTKSRKIQIFGPYHDYKWKIIPNKYTQHPEYSHCLLNIIKSFFHGKSPTFLKNSTLKKMFDGKKCELFVNLYLSDNSLRAHHDHRTTYDEIIIGVSLLSKCHITFVGKNKKIKVEIPRRSLYVMSGESRFVYKHSIQKGDIKEKRISLTYRTIK